MNAESITGRTRLEASVGVKGDVNVTVTRNGQVVNTFSLPVEDGMTIHTQIIHKDGLVEVWQPGPHGQYVLEGRYGQELPGAAPDESPDEDSGEEEVTDG